QTRERAGTWFIRRTRRKGGQPAERSVLVRKKSLAWLWYGAAGILCGICLDLIAYFVCGRTLGSCRWIDGAEYAYERAIHSIGQAMGAQYGIAAFYPNRGTQIFLEVLFYGGPWIVWFLMGVAAYAIVRIVQKVLKAKSDRLATTES